MGQCKIIHGR